MLLTPTMSHYRQSVDVHGALSPAQCAVAGMVRVARDALTKHAYSNAIAREMGALAHHNPLLALSRAHTMDRGLRGAVTGGLLGAAGGALSAEPGQGEGMALRGALAGTLLGGAYGAHRGHQGFQNMVRSPVHAPDIYRRTRAMQAAGAPLHAAFTG